MAHCVEHVPHVLCDHVHTTFLFFSFIPGFIEWSGYYRGNMRSMRKCASVIVSVAKSVFDLIISSTVEITTRNSVNADEEREH